MKIYISEFFENMHRKFEFHLNRTRITGTLHEDLCTFIVTSRSVLLRMRYVPDKSCRENRKTTFVENRVIYMMM
jgi:hypothetical protein